MISATEGVGVLGEVTALALVVAFSPFTVLPAIALVVHSARPRPTGLAFICGWLVGKAAITSLFVGVPALLHGLPGSPPHWTAWLRVVVGIVFIVGGLWYWRREPGAARSEASGWLARIKTITPAGAAAVGVALTVVNPKVVLACATAGFAIGSAALGAPATVAWIAYFALLGGSTAALPILAYLVWSHRVDRALERFGAWMTRNQVVITAVVMLLLGVGLTMSGVGAL